MHRRKSYFCVYILCLGYKNYIMGISCAEYNARIGLFYSKSTQVQMRKLLDIEVIIFVNLLSTFGCTSIPIMFLLVTLRYHIDSQDPVAYWDPFGGDSAPNCITVYSGNTLSGVNDHPLFGSDCDYVSNPVPICRLCNSLQNHEICVTRNSVIPVLLGILLLFISLLILLSGDVEVNPGPYSSSSSDISSTESVSDATLDAFNTCLNTYTSFVHLNVQSLATKIDLLDCELRNIDILCFTETWLNESIKTGDICLEDFHPPIRKDREGRLGGGVAVYINSDFHMRHRQDLDVRGLECLWTEVSMSKNRTILIGTFYRPPDSDDNIYTLIDYSFEQASDTGIENILVLGDFNADFSKQKSEKLKNILLKYDMFQFINEPTHFTENSSSCLDLVIANNNNFLDLVHVGQPFLGQNTRYHCPTYGIIKFDKPVSTCFKRRIWLYDRGNYELFREKLSAVDWDLVLLETDIDTLVDKFSNLLTQAALASIPSKIITVRKSEPPWINNLVRRAIRKRNRLHKKAKKTNNPDHWSKFRKFRNRTINIIRNRKQEFLDNCISKLRSESLSIREWWKLASKVADFKTRVSSIPPLLDNDEIICNDLEKAEAFNTFFASQSNLDDSNKSLPANDSPPDNCLDTLVLREEEVKDVLQIMNITKACGPDGISPRLLKIASDIIARPLCHIFNLSLVNMYFPLSWKIANVIPVYKKGEKNLVSNYRPISLLSVISKSFERCVYKHLMNFTRDLLSEHQSGFIRNDSTRNQLLYVANEFGKALDEGKDIRIVFFDISKAFDRVWHKGLLFKLKKMGITGNLLLWLSSYLSDRKQRVVFNGHESSLSLINSGVPQGSILGPYYF